MKHPLRTSDIRHLTSFPNRSFSLLEFSIFVKINGGEGHSRSLEIFSCTPPLSASPRVVAKSSEKLFAEG